MGRWIVASNKDSIIAVDERDQRAEKSQIEDLHTHTITDIVQSPGQ